ncbi:LysR family transcriptional regulator [Novosphingobium profundi]|uniref:LysR family transcriptional regulator n=1 Tax=Novosphingobium profundi TaxID=1774954 RepID=UPI001BDB6343|nr:LysR family transcriptional regulator [Novosphingobium profundi]MBT0667298.1 LysR family transcriptional regulator [Novosphingobium profundi]
MADRLTGIEIFVRAMRLGSLSAAAREAGISAVMAAKHLAALEDRLGVTLVNRTTRRLALTEAGAHFLEQAERIISDLREAEYEVSARAVVIEGLLRVSAPATFGVMHLSGLIAEFAEVHPGVIIELGLNDRYVDLLEERWDVAIRIGRLPDSALLARRLAPVRLSVCAAPKYLSRRGTPTTVAELSVHDCLGYTLAPHVGTHMWGFGADGSLQVPVRGSLRANNGEALMIAACHGQGIIYAPRFMTAQRLAAGELVELALDAPPIDLGAIHTVTHPTRRPAAKTRAWIDFLVKRLPSLAKDW